MSSQADPTSGKRFRSPYRHHSRDQGHQHFLPEKNFEDTFTFFLSSISFFASL
jgi:hypothetical protein